MSGVRAAIDVDVLKNVRKKGEDNPQFLDIGAPIARHSRTHDLTLVFQQKAVEAKEKLPRLTKEIHLLEEFLKQGIPIAFYVKNKIIPEVRLITAKRLDDFYEEPEKPLFEKVIKNKDLIKIVFHPLCSLQKSRKIQTYLFILQSKKNLLQELKKRLLDFQFIDEMIGVRRRDEQVVQATHEEAADFLIKTEAISGAKAKHQEEEKKQKKKLIADLKKSKEAAALKKKKVRK